MEMVLETKIYIGKKKMVTLFALLRQIELSIDRGRWTEFNEVIKFLFSDDRIISLYNDLTTYLGDNIDLKLNNVPKELPWYKKILYKFQKSDFLTLSEIQTICFLLDKLIKVRFESNNDIVNLHLAVSQLAYNVVEPRLDYQDKNLGYSVEHFVQNEELESKSIKEIIN